jgi:predicted HTH domain antitoxin
MKRELGQMSRELDEKAETMRGQAKFVVVEQEIEVGVIGPDEMGIIMALELYESLWEVSLWQAANI